MEKPNRYKLLSDPSSSFNIKKTGHLYEADSVNFTGWQPDQLLGKKRSQIVTFSKGSRRRMIKAIRSFGARCPIFGTTTYDDPMPSVEEAKKHNANFMRRILRSFKGYWIVWRMEFQPSSGRPHFHYLIYSKEKNAYISYKWFRKNWRLSTGRNSLYPDIQGMRSHRGGLYYCAKYLCKDDEEGFEKYQATHPKSDVGRFWGIYGRWNVPEESTVKPLNNEDFKYFLMILLEDKAIRSLKRELKERGKTWVWIECFQNTSEWDDLLTAKIKSLFVNGGVPTWHLSDESNFIETIVRRSRERYSQQDIDDTFSF